MPEERLRVIKKLRKRWDERAERHAEWYKTFEGATEHYVDWELLKGYLPKDKNAKILDAAGGTGRITLPLAKMGYSVTLCDISPGMLKVARKKLLKEEVLDKVEIVKCDICNLHFADESFDFVISWDNAIEAIKELIRVTKRGGKISIFLINKYGVAIKKFPVDPDFALNLLKSKSAYILHHEEETMVISVEEAKEFIEKEGIKIIDIYAVCGMLTVLSIPEKIQESQNWDEKFFKQVTEMLLRLSKEPSIKGLSKHLVLYGERI